jgi:ATP-dependent phosphofructokinase / diphosphate-dependent phosphofructokinase
MPSRPKNIFYAQSGGPTPVINATAQGVIETARKNKNRIGKVFAGKNGIVGALHEELIDTSAESLKAIANLRYTPASAFGSCRYKLKSLKENQAEYDRLIEVFAAHDIGYFFYNGGGDSQDTANKVAKFSKLAKYPLTCIGIPKTIDNDLPLTDNCPGYGSVAKYLAVSIQGVGLDVASMAATSTKIFVLEVMGRHAGWIAAATGLAATHEGLSPHIILFPELLFDASKFLKKVASVVKEYGYCVIVVSEGVRNQQGQFLAEAGLKDAFGHTQLGGVAPVIAQLIQSSLGFKYHWAVADYLQRSARYIASKTDVEQAYALGKAAVDYALAGKNAILPVIVRTSLKPYRWKVGEAPLAAVANKEKHLPRSFITGDGFGITKACKEYIAPLIQGEDYPPYKNGLPQYVRLKNKLLPRKLTTFSPKA